MINIPDIVGWTPMHIACYYKRKEIILLLLKNQANLYFKDREGIYPYDLLQNDQVCLEAIKTYLKHSKNSLKKCNNYDQDNEEYNDRNGNYNQVTRSKTEHYLKKYFSKQKLISKNEDNVNLSFNEDNINDFIKLSNTNEKIIESYKFIPKKPKFYLNFKESQSFTKNSLVSSFTYMKASNNPNNTLTSKSMAHNIYTGKLKTKNKPISLLNLYTSHNNYVKVPKELQNIYPQANNVPYLKTQSIKAPNAFPDTKILAELKRYSSIPDSPSKYHLKENNTDSFKTIPDNETLDIKKIYNSIKIENGMTENEKTLKMLDSEESEDSFIIDFDISLNEESINNQKLKMKGNVTERRLKNKSLPEKVFFQSEDEKIAENEETFIENNWDKNNCIIFEENYPIKEIHFINHNNMKSNDVIILDNHSPNKLITNLETEYFLTKININSIIFQSFLLDETMFGKLMIKLFICSFDFALLLFLNVYDTQNNIEKFISVLRTSNLDKYLLSLIILNVNNSNPSLENTILESYISSFDFSNLTLCEALHKVLKNITMQKDYIIIDKFAKYFSKVFYERLEKEDDYNHFNSEKAMYLIVFILILLDIDFKLKDFMILVKYLNEGLNFDNDFLRESYKYIKLLGLTNLHCENIFLNKHKLFLTKENSRNSKFFKYSFCEDWIMIFNKNEICDKLIYIKNYNLYNIVFDDKNETVVIHSKNQKKNLLIFKHKSNYIKYSKFMKITMKFENYIEMKILLRKIKDD